MTPATSSQSWKRMNAAAPQPAGAEPMSPPARSRLRPKRALAGALRAFGRDRDREASDIDGTVWYSVNLYPDGRARLDDMLEAAWANGAPDAHDHPRLIGRHRRFLAEFSRPPVDPLREG